MPHAGSLMMATITNLRRPRVRRLHEAMTPRKAKARGYLRNQVRFCVRVAITVRMDFQELNFGRNAKMYQNAELLK